MNRLGPRAWMASLGGVALLASALAALVTWRTPRAPAPAAAPVSAQLSVARPHRRAITSLAWSGDGRLLLSTSIDNTARLWQVDNGALLRVFAFNERVRGIGNHLSQAVFVEGDRRVIIAGSSGTRLWNVADGRLVSDLDAAGDMVAAVAANDAAGIAASAGSGPAEQGARLFLRLHSLAGAPRREFDVTDLHRVASLSFSPDGTKLALAGQRITRTVPGGVQTAPVIRIVDTRDGRGLLELRDLVADASWVRFDGEGRIAYQSGTRVFISDLAGKRSAPFDGDPAGLSADGTVLAVFPGAASTSDDDQAAAAAQLYDLGSRQLLVTLPWAGARHERMRNRVVSYAFRPDGKQLAIGFADGKLAVWDRASRSYVSMWPARPSGPRRLQLTDREGKRVALPTPNGVALWDLEKGQRIELDLALEPELIAVSPDGSRVFAAASARKWMWDAASGTELWNAAGDIDTLSAAAFHPDQDILATAGYSAVRFSKASSDEFVQLRADGFHGVSALVFSRDGKRLAVGDELGEVRILPAHKGKALSSIPAPDVNATVTALALNQDGSRVTVSYGNGYNRTLVYDADSGKQLHPAGGHAAAINSLAVDGAGRLLVTGGEDDTAIVRDWVTGAEFGRLAHSGAVLAVGLSENGKRLFTYADYGMRVWDLAEPSKPVEMLGFFELPFRRWAVADTRGRFDANDLETGGALHWLMSDAPLRALPPEIFMRDYFEPRLAARLLGCRDALSTDPRACDNAFAPLAPVATLNRVQPRVEIVGISAGPEPGLAQVRVAVTQVEDDTQSNGKTDSGAYDLRLFRDGQLVHRWPAFSRTVGSGRAGRPHPGSDLLVWRQETRIDMPAWRTRVELPFTVRLPTPRQARGVEISAYAFNHDRVRSASASRTLQVPGTPQRRPPKAWIVTIGVNGYQAPSRNLSFAVNDALVMRKALGGIEGYEVAPVTLTSETAPETWTATKSNIREVLHRLAGGRAHVGTLAGVPGAERLARAGPDDLVVLSFSGHGHTEPDGTFYMLSSDSGPVADKTSENTLPPEALAQFISSEELGDWLAPVDAGQMALIIDTCHSGGVVERPGFKPGPMGDRGFGQLAYDKAMLILAAAQRDDVAIESRDLKQGLLTYALVHDGLMPLSPGAPILHADRNRNRELTLAEWLAYGAQRTPGLFADVRSGRVTLDYVGKDPDPGPEWREKLARRAQTPALFDFTGGRKGAVVARHVPPPLPPGVTPLPEKVERNWVPFPQGR